MYRNFFTKFLLPNRTHKLSIHSSFLVAMNTSLLSKVCLEEEIWYTEMVSTAFYEMP